VCNVMSRKPLQLKKCEIWGLFYSKNVSRATFFVYWSTQMVNWYLSYLPVSETILKKKHSVKQDWRNRGVMDFWRSVNPISTGGSLLCPTHYYLLRASRAIKNEGNYVLLSRKPTNIFLSGWFVITSFFIHKKMKISILLENKDSMQ
jgi:hypothetical protein